MTARRPPSGARRGETHAQTHAQTPSPSPAQTPAQTIGPFFAPALLGRGPEVGEFCVPDGTRGTRIRIEGRVLDGAGEPVSDAMLEVWQANADGRYDHPADTRGDTGASVDDAFHGFARLGTDAAGGFRFETVKPGPVPGRGNAWQAPHLNLIVFARGLLDHLSTRVYFDDEGAANAADPVLRAIDPARRGTLVATLDDARRAPPPLVYRFDIRLQGAGETVFLDF